MMKMRLKILWINLLLIALGIPAEAQSQFTFDRDDPPTMEMLMGVKERFTYEVRYGFLNLGTVEVVMLPDSSVNGEPAKYMRTVMRANPSIPFVGKREVIYENLFTYDEEAAYSHVFWRQDVHDDDPNRARILFDRDQGKVFFFDKGEPADTLDLVEPASGGDVIFYYSRMFAGIDTPYSLPVYIENNMGYVKASSSGKTEMRSYAAFDEPIETYLSEGNADVDGPFGFTGRFKSWFATDDLRIPLEAHARIIFGNVKVRLTSYEILE